MSKSVRWLCLVGVLGAVALLLSIFYNERRGQESLEDVRRFLENALQKGAYQQTFKAASDVVRDDPTQGGIAYLGALAAVQIKRFDDALQLVDVAIEHHDKAPASLDALWAFKGLVLWSLERAGDAESSYRKALRIDPHNEAARERLAFVLMLSGRGWETFPYRVAALQENRIRREDLVVLASHQELLAIRPLLEKLIQASPNDPVPLLGLACWSIEQGDWQRAERYLKRVMAIRPREPVAWAALGELYLRMPDRAERLADWNRELPATCEAYPGIWIVRGFWAERLGDWPGAARCFGEAVRRDPTDRVALMQWISALNAAGEPTLAEPLVHYGSDLEELVSRATELRGGAGTPETIERIALLCERLGRYWEADGWARWLLRTQPPTAEQLHVADPQARVAADRKARRTLRALRTRIADRLQPGLPQVDPQRHPAGKVDIESFPLPDFATPPADSKSFATADLDRRPLFRDVTQSAGLDFTFFNSDDPKTPGRRIFDSTGGGVAVFDYDQDGLPDIYFTQDCPWPVDPGARRYRDRLYRNLGDGHFIDVTEPAGLGDSNYSQGVAAGDFDNDGWPDLLVANIGQNRLYLNNGDGTFSDITTTAGIDGRAWTTSCMICDVDGDGNPDLYEVNYVQGEKAFRLICKRGDVAGICSPHEFESAQDRLRRNQGDGTFHDITGSCGIVNDRGKGLGIIAGDLIGTGRISIFIANDTTPNALFVPVGKPGELFRLRDQAVLRGVAYDRDGNSQGCMGIAVDDADGDGRIDWFVTNFFRESNAFYRQQEAGTFMEDSESWGLREPSLPVLGFGTQFLDAELDGLPDLVVANGHIDDYGGQEPLEMAPQYYRNLGGRFAEWPASQLGPFFQRKRLGRGLALIDFDRDGREDFVVSHIGTPAALVQNQSLHPGHFLSVELVATQSARDAYGTRVTVVAAGRRRVRQLVAGGGYQATNERCLVFGLGSHDRIDRLVVRWPSGKEEIYEGLAVDRRVKLVESRGMW